MLRESPSARSLEQGWFGEVRPNVDPRGPSRCYFGSPCIELQQHSAPAGMARRDGSCQGTQGPPRPRVQKCPKCRRLPQDPLKHPGPPQPRNSEIDGIPETPKSLETTSMSHTLLHESRRCSRRRILLPCRAAKLLLRGKPVNPGGQLRRSTLAINSGGGDSVTTRFCDETCGVRAQCASPTRI